jgi:hypothetical protein
MIDLDCVVNQRGDSCTEAGRKKKTGGEEAAARGSGLLRYKGGR